jgi:hypothetical protein
VNVFPARFRVFAFIALFIQSALLSGGGCSSANAQPEPLTAHGIILAVSQRTFTELESIDIRTDSGEVMSFKVEGDTSLTPGHAREHMSFVDPVTVYYRENGEDRVAYLITD